MILTKHRKPELPGVYAVYHSNGIIGTALWKHNRWTASLYPHKYCSRIIGWFEYK